MSDQFIDPYARYLLERFVPASLFLNPDLDVLYAHGEIDRYFRLPRALVRFNLERMLGGETLIVMSNGVNRCLEGNLPVVYRNVTLSGPGGSRLVDLQFQKVSVPVRESPLVLLEIFPRDVPVPEQPDRQSVQRSVVLEEEVVGLERRLRAVRSKKQRLLSDQEATNEELYTANRELMASNEELQSTNEELQSVNEELYTVNSELQMKNQALVMANDDMLNLLRSLEIGTLFLDARFCIRRFTSAICRYIELMESDIGRPISDFANNIMGVDIAEISQKVFHTLEKYEQEVRDNQGRSHLLRVLPYRTQDDQIQGLVLTLVGVEEMVRSREEMMEMAARFKVIFQRSANIIMELDESGRIRDVNRGLPAFGRSYLMGKSLYELLATPDRPIVERLIREVADTKRPASRMMNLQPAASEKYRFEAKFIPLRMFQSAQPEEEGGNCIVMILERLK